MYSYESYDILTNFPFPEIKRPERQKNRSPGSEYPLVNWNRSGSRSVELGGSLHLNSNRRVPGISFSHFLRRRPEDFYEVAKYATFLSLGGPAGPCWTVNLDLWKSLPQKVQQIIWEEAQKYNDAIPGIVAKMKNDAIQLLKEKGVTFYPLPSEDRKEWMAVLKDMPKNFIKEREKRGLPGKPVVQSYIQEMEKTGYTSPIQYNLWITPADPEKGEGGKKLGRCPPLKIPRQTMESSFPKKLDY